MSELEQFISSTRPAHKRSPLHAHAAVIQRLREEGFSWQQVASYLSRTAGVHMHRNNLLAWWARHERDKGTSALPSEQAVPTDVAAPSLVSVTSRESTGKSALDALLDVCQADVPGLPDRHRPMG